MAFEIAEYLRQTGFVQTRESDKRDIFEKEFYNAFQDRTFMASVTIHYNAGYTKYNSYSIWLMSIELIQKLERQIIFEGIAPTTFDEAANIFELVLPTPEYLMNRDVTRS